MRHKVFGNQLHRNTKQAKALYRGLVTNLLERGRIETTMAKAKAVRGMVDKVINLAKTEPVMARRQVIKIMGTTNSLNRLFGEIAPRMTNRNSGYTRIVHLGQRFSDTAEKVYLELVEGIETAAPAIAEKAGTKSETLEKTETKTARTAKPAATKARKAQPKKASK